VEAHSQEEEQQQQQPQQQQQQQKQTEQLPLSPQLDERNSTSD
jgi:hypothetical protein